MGDNMKALLLRVGIDKGCGGALAPIFSDGSFEYIPIPELNENSMENRTFSNTYGARWTQTGIKKKPLIHYLPSKIAYYKLHYDPEFESFTYGDPSPSKRNYLLKLEKNDLLVFYAGLTPYKTDNFKEALYVIGYFVVKEVIDFNELNNAQMKRKSEVYSNNAHIKSGDTGNLAIVVGNNQSKLLNKAILISEPRKDKRGRNYHAVSEGIEKLLGIKGSIQRSIPPRMIINDVNLENLKKLINFK
jgi:hypothetical protein